MKKTDYSKIEEPIRHHVAALNDAGWETDSSCGHEMWVRVDCPLERERDLAAFVRVRIGSSDFRIERDYGWCDGAHATVRFPKAAGHEGQHDLLLLKVDPAAHPLYFVLRTRRYANEYSTSCHLEHLYNEHTCPTNWTDSIVAVIANGDEDPHGFARFVAVKLEPLDFDEEAQRWSDVFPEITDAKP